MHAIDVFASVARRCRENTFAQLRHEGNGSPLKASGRPESVVGRRAPV